ncbi:DUF3592 domain-containing protein [Spirillospora sp. NPDC047279]|uniref:DUF3592 domain-containing protein n=1 Tax=Spirillospora sp. NPDC047279 TaxID=3155478 RepID=UPI0033D51251
MNVEVVLSGRNTSARFDGSRLRVTRGRTTWTVPVQAVRGAGLLQDRSVRVELDAEVDERGLGRTVTLPYRNAAAALAFVERLQGALGPATGSPQVTVETSVRRLSLRQRRTLQIGGAVLAYLLALVALGVLRSDLATLLITSWFAPAGVGVLYLCRTFMIRDVRALRRRGVTVAGRSEGTVRAFGGNLFYHHLLTFRTADGRNLQRVRSRGTVSSFEKGGRPLDVTYDPGDPRVATGPLTLSHALWTVVVAVFGLVLLLSWIVVLVVAALGA